MTPTPTPDTPDPDPRHVAALEAIDDVLDVCERVQDIVAQADGATLAPRLSLCAGLLTGLGCRLLEAATGQRACLAVGGPEWSDLLWARDAQLAAATAAGRPERDGERTLGELTREAACLLLIADDDGPEIRALAAGLWPGDHRDLPAAGTVARRGMITAAALRCLRELARLPRPGQAPAEGGQS